MYTSHLVRLCSRRSFRLSVVSVVILYLLVIIVLKVKTNSLESISGLVPNIVHFIIFNNTKLDFTSFLSITSVLKVQRPEKILVHCDCKQFEDHYWGILLEISHKVLVPIEVVYLPRPTHVFGQTLSSVFHSTDVARIHVLMNYGGIYLDTDVLILKRLNEFFKFEMVVGWPPNENIGTQILIAKKDAQFLKLWLNGYHRYRPRAWYYNAGQYPTEQILEKNPKLIHRVPKLFGVHNLLDKLYSSSKWPEWRDYFSVHLLSRHPPAPKGLNETSVIKYAAPFGEIARWLLFDLEPHTINLHDVQFYGSSTFPPDYIQ
ncbi:uncharacterized protein LOC142319382 [Lycorma delicatula]|uniref:uncharacterized protein LOC142319382 n=1 Tax=Lycorma delicatula TaxID=130591 RepID=UPI003F5143AA